VYLWVQCTVVYAPDGTLHVWSVVAHYG